MGTYVCLLRGINVGGHKKIKMPDLKYLFESVDLEDVTTYIQSGNVVFKSTGLDVATLETRLEQAVLSDFGYDVSIFIRTNDEFKTLISNLPFRNEHLKSVYVTFLKKVPAAANVEEVTGLTDPDDRLQYAGKEVYLFCPNRYGRTRFNSNFLERKLGVQTTTRNWQTVCKLCELAN